MLDRIKSQLSLLTEGFTAAEKVKFLKNMGYNSFSEIEQLNDIERKDLFQFLLVKNSSICMAEKFDGYTINRPAKPKSVSEIGFSIKE